MDIITGGELLVVDYMSFISIKRLPNNIPKRPNPLHHSTTRGWRLCWPLILVSFFFKEINVIVFLLFVEKLEGEKKRGFLSPDTYIFLISHEMPQVPTLEILPFALYGGLW